MDNQWVWHPHDHAQSLDHLIANNVVTVSGHLKCSSCKVYQYLQFDLEAAFHELRDRLVAHREGIQAPEFGFRAANFASTSCGKSVCPDCRKRTMSPVMPEREQ